MKINTKLSIALGILCIFVMLSGIFGIVYTTVVSKNLNTVTTKTTPLVETMGDMIINLLEMEVLIEEVSSEKNTRQLESFGNQLKALNKNFKKAETIAHNLITDEGLMAKAIYAGEQQQAFYSSAQELLNLNKQSNPTESQRTVLKETAKTHAKQAIDTLEEVLIRAYVFNKKANDSSIQALQSTITMLALTTFLSLIFAIIIGIYLSRSLVRPINNMAEAATKLSKGNFDVSIEEPTSNDETSHLIIVFNKMVKSLQKLIKQSPGLKRYIDLSLQKEQTIQEYKLASRSSYLIKDATPHRAYDILNDKIDKGAAGLCITREEPDSVKEKYHTLETQWIWLTEVKHKKYTTTSNLQTITKKINEFTTKKTTSIILIDRIDYLITQHGFAHVLKFLTTINDQAMSSNTIILIPVDPTYLDPRNLAFLEKELKELPSPSAKEEMPEELIKILKVIKDRKALKKQTSFKDISKEFNITAPTTKKKLAELQETGYIKIVKHGRNKLIEPTAKAEQHL